MKKPHFLFASDKKKHPSNLYDYKLDGCFFRLIEPLL